MTRTRFGAPRNPTGFTDDFAVYSQQINGNRQDARKSGTGTRWDNARQSHDPRSIGCAFSVLIESRALLTLRLYTSVDVHATAIERVISDRLSDGRIWADGETRSLLTNLIFDLLKRLFATLQFCMRCSMDGTNLSGET